ncbi:MAG TPA: peptide ABC transporter substrate-binding protein [Herpetosiphonaceae bacterium]
MIELRRAFVVACGLTLLVLALLTGCDFRSPVTPMPEEQTPAATTTGTTTADTTPRRPEASPTPSVPQGGALTLRIQADIPDLKPWDLRSRGEEYAADLMYNGLVRLDAQLQPQPDLAEKWEISPDGGLITFTIRSGVTWHDERPLTSDDVLWTLNMLRTITPTNALLADLRAHIGQVRSPITQTVVVSLTQPYAPLLSELAVPILPRHRLQSRTPEQISQLNFWDVPIGSGPFALDRREPNQSIAFVRNANFFRGAPNLEQVALVVAPAATVAADALSDEQLLAGEFPDATQPFSGTATPDSLRSGAYQEHGWYGVVFNVRPDHLFSDMRLREALSRAVDVEALVADVTQGRGEPIATTLSKTAWAYPADLSLPSHNVDEARRLLDEAGWTAGPDGVRQKDGRALSAKLWVRGDDQRRLAAALRIAQAAEAIGMRLEVTPANFDTVILTKLAPPYDFDLLLGSWVNAPNSAGFASYRFYDPDDFTLFHSSRVWRGQGDPRTGLRNVGGFSNAEYDQAAEQARASYDPAARAQAIQTIQTILAREHPYLLLWSDRIAVLLNERVTSEDGAIPLDTPRYLWNVERWYLRP